MENVFTLNNDQRLEFMTILCDLIDNRHAPDLRGFYNEVKRQIDFAEEQDSTYTALGRVIENKHQAPQIYEAVRRLLVSPVPAK